MAYERVKTIYNIRMLIKVAALSKAWVCARMSAGIAGSNHYGVIMSVVSVVCCQLQVFAKGRSLVQRSPVECAVRSRNLNRGTLGRSRSVAPQDSNLRPLCFKCQFCMCFYDSAFQTLSPVEPFPTLK